MKRLILIIVLMFSFNSLIIAHDSYNKGDVIKFKGVNWIVIKNSSEDDDYVVLLKDKALCNEELGEYAYQDTDTMQYGENSNYNESNVKKLLENSYINTLGIDNLKSINGYKIRLLNHDEFLSALNNYNFNGYCWMSDDAEEWIIKDTDGNVINTYWGMSKNQDYVRSVTFFNNEVLYGNWMYYLNNSVRPVINLLKSSIVNEDSSNGSTDEEPNNNQNTINENEENENGINSNVDDTNATGNNSSEVVKVPNTLIKASMIFIIFGLAFICLGANIYIIFLDKNKK